MITAILSKDTRILYTVSVGQNRQVNRSCQSKSGSNDDSNLRLDSDAPEAARQPRVIFHSRKMKGASDVESR
jgi:hypothetical protein